MPKAPEERTVASVMAVSEEPWGDKKDMLTHEVAFEGVDREWKIYANVAWPVKIERGAVLEGWFNHDKGTFGLSNKHKGEHAKRGGSTSSTSSSDKFDRRPEHPRNEARMIHTSALSAAPTYINQMLAMGWLEVPKDEDAYWQLVTRVAGRLARSYQGAISATEQAPSPQPQLNGGEVPADMSGLPTGPVSDDSQIKF